MPRPATQEVNRQNGVNGTEFRVVTQTPQELLNPGQQVRQDLILEYVTAHPNKLRDMPMSTLENLQLVQLAIEPLRLERAMETARGSNYRAFDVFVVAFTVEEIGGMENLPGLVQDAGWEKVTDEGTIKFRKDNSPIRPNVDELFQYTGIVDNDGDVPLLGLHIQRFKPAQHWVDESVHIYAVDTPIHREEVKRSFREEFRGEVAKVAVLSLELAALQADRPETLDLSPAKLVKATLEKLGQNVPEWEINRELPGLSAIAVEELIRIFSGFPKLKETAKDLKHLREIPKRGVIFLEHSYGLKEDEKEGWHPEDLKIVIPIDKLS